MTCLQHDILARSLADVMAGTAMLGFDIALIVLLLHIAKWLKERRHVSL